MIAIKLSDDQAAQLGITKETDAGATLVAKLGEIDSLKASFDKLTETLTAQVKGAVDSSASATTAINSLSAKVDGFKIVSEDRIKELASLSAATALGSAGFSPVKPAGVSDPTPPAKKDFQAIVAGYVAEGKTKSEAVRLAVTNHPTEFAEAKAKGIPVL